MYNKKSKTSAILTIVTAILIIGFAIMLPLMQYNTPEDSDDLSGLVMIVVIIYGFPSAYLSSIPYVIVALIFGSKMCKQQDRKKLISLNVRMLITTCVLLPVFAFSMAFCSELIKNSTWGLMPIVYTIVMAVTYIASLIAQIATIVALKKSPEQI